jgi:predicted RNase H-like nuclease
MGHEDVLVVGIDVGWSEARPSTGFASITLGKRGAWLAIARSTALPEDLERAWREVTISADVRWGHGARPPVRPPARTANPAKEGPPHRSALRPQVLAIDGPLAPHGRSLPLDRPRSCEAVLMRRPFAARCRPADWRDTLRGQPLHHAAMTIASRFRPYLSPSSSGAKAIIEAFPDAFMAVGIPDQLFAEPKAPGESRTDWLHRLWLKDSPPRPAYRLLCHLLPSAFAQCLRNQLALVRNRHEKSAAICALTALCVYLRSFVALGDARTGYIILPPPGVWEEWARAAMKKQLADFRASRGEPVCPQLLLPDGREWKL